MTGNGKNMSTLVNTISHMYVLYHSKNTSVIFKSMFIMVPQAVVTKHVWHNGKVSICAMLSLCPNQSTAHFFYECQEKLGKAKASFSPKVSLPFEEHSQTMDYLLIYLIFALWKSCGHLTPQPSESYKGQREQPIFSQWDSSPSNIPKSKEDIEWNESSNQTEMERYETPWAHLQSQNSPPWEFQTLRGLKPGNHEKMQLAGMVAGQEKEHWDWTNSFLLSVQDMVLDCWSFLSTGGWCL